MKIARLLQAVGWWGMLAICLTFGGFALWMGILEILSLAGLSPDAKMRAAPIVFVVHAISGGAALMAGPFQFNRSVRDGNRDLHRALGHVYVVAVWTASIAGLWSAAFFAVDIAARIAFASAAILWFGATTFGFRRAQQGNIVAHREWMLRSFALSLFFVTFEFWVEGLGSRGLPHAVAYPLGVFLGWFINLLLAEVWIRALRVIYPAATLYRVGIRP